MYKKNVKLQIFFKMIEKLYFHVLSQNKIKKSWVPMDNFLWRAENPSKLLILGLFLHILEIFFLISDFDSNQGLLWLQKSLFGKKNYISECPTSLAMYVWNKRSLKRFWILCPICAETCAVGHLCNSLDPP